MGEYVTGSVSNLISNKSGSKTKAKKIKFEIIKNVQSEISHVKHEEPVVHNKKVKTKPKKRELELHRNEENKISRTKNKTDKESVFDNLEVKKKKKNAVASNKFSERNFPSEKGNAFKSSCGPEFKAKVKSKKRKKSNYNEAIKPTGERKNLLDLDFVLNDSENEDENAKKNSLANSKKHLTSKENNENTVFVGNIPINYDKKRICKVFCKFGEIQSARIRCVPVADINISKKVAAIKKQFNPKRNSLVAYVNFKSKDSANSAVKANGLVIDGHHLRIDFAESNKEWDNNKAVFIGGLPFDIEDNELWEIFQNCGKITSVRIIRDSRTSMGKGFGYVNFDSTAAVELALQLDGQELKKRKINIKRCVNARNKNKLNAFGKKKSKELTTQLLCKKGKIFKEEKKKLKKESKQLSADFKGKRANIKQKKKKKLSKAALHQRKLVKLLNVS